MKFYTIIPGITVNEECHQRVEKFLEAKKAEGNPMRKAHLMDALTTYLQIFVGVENYEEYCMRTMLRYDKGSNVILPKPTKTAFHSKHMIDMLTKAGY